MLDLLRHAGRSTQVIVTTHSPEALDAKWIRNKHLRVVTWDAGGFASGPDLDRDAGDVAQAACGGGRAAAVQCGDGRGVVPVSGWRFALPGFGV